MALNAFDMRAGAPDVVAHVIRLLGTGAANFTKQVGEGVTVVRSGTGAHTITWADNPGTYLGWSPAFGAATPADLAGHTAVREVYVAATKSMAFTIYNASFAAHDLEADEYIDLTIIFRRTAVTG